MTATLPLSHLLKRLWSHLSLRRQHQFIAIFALMLISTFTEVISLGAVLPFLAVLTAPEKVFAYAQVAAIAKDLGIMTANDLVMPLTLLFALAALAAGALRMLLLWAGMRLRLATGSDLSIELYRRTLYQPYHVHLTRI